MNLLNGQGGGDGRGFDLVGGDFAAQVAGKINALGDQHVVEGEFGGGQQRHAALQRGDPMFLRAVVGVAVHADVVDAPVETVEVGAAVHVQVAGAEEEAERVEPDAAEAADDVGAVELVEVDGPRLDEIERQVAGEAHEAHAQLFHVVAAAVAPRLIHGRLLIGLAGDAQHFGVIQQIQDARDVIDAHVEHRAAGGIGLLHEVGRAVAVYVGATAAAEAGGARMVDLAEATRFDQRFGGLGLVGSRAC